MEDLKEQSFNPENVFRMKKQRKREEKEMFNIRLVKHFLIKMETQKPKNTVGQCHRCQHFGHAQKYCTLPPRCVKCAENHLTKDCTKPSNIPVKCANCGGHHPASYRGCTKFPKRHSVPTQNAQVDGGSFATVASNNNTPNKMHDTRETLLRQVLQIAKSMNIKT